jgi:hypothetical protein
MKRMDEIIKMTKVRERVRVLAIPQPLLKFVGSVDTALLLSQIIFGVTGQMIRRDGFTRAIGSGIRRSI